jgi:hypothetical protein
VKHDNEAKYWAPMLWLPPGTSGAQVVEQLTMHFDLKSSSVAMLHCTTCEEMVWDVFLYPLPFCFFFPLKKRPRGVVVLVLVLIHLVHPVHPSSCRACACCLEFPICFYVVASWLCRGSSQTPFDRLSDSDISTDMCTELPEDCRLGDKAVFKCTACGK